MRAAGWAVLITALSVSSVDAAAHRPKVRTDEARFWAREHEAQVERLLAARDCPKPPEPPEGMWAVPSCGPPTLPGFDGLLGAPTEDADIAFTAHYPALRPGRSTADLIVDECVVGPCPKRATSEGMTWRASRGEADPRGRFLVFLAMRCWIAGMKCPRVVSDSFRDVNMTSADWEKTKASIRREMAVPKPGSAGHLQGLVHLACDGDGLGVMLLDWEYTAEIVAEKLPLTAHERTCLEAGFLAKPRDPTDTQYWLPFLVHASPSTQQAIVDSYVRGFHGFEPDAAHHRCTDMELSRCRDLSLTVRAWWGYWLRRIGIVGADGRTSPRWRR